MDLVKSKAYLFKFLASTEGNPCHLLETLLQSTEDLVKDLLKKSTKIYRRPRKEGRSGLCQESADMFVLKVQQKTCSMSGRRSQKVQGRLLDLMY